MTEILSFTIAHIRRMVQGNDFTDVFVHSGGGVPWSLVLCLVPLQSGL